MAYFQGPAAIWFTRGYPLPQPATNHYETIKYNGLMLIVTYYN
jgi:hypothetical protein